MRKIERVFGFWSWEQRTKVRFRGLARPAGFARSSSLTALGGFQYKTDATAMEVPIGLL
jgi:hypothetical protein